MKKTLFFLLALLASSSLLHAQKLLISCDGTGADRPGDFEFMDQELAIGKVNTAVTLHFTPGKIRRQTIALHAPARLALTGSYFLVGAHDSLGIRFDTTTKKYIITGGKYPGNYTIYDRCIRVMSSPPRVEQADRFGWSPALDSTYAHYLDDISARRTAVLEDAWTKGQLSRDVYDYMLAVIRYSHIGWLLAFDSPSLRAGLPNTASTFCPTITPDDFRKDQYAPQLTYIYAVTRYIRQITNTDPVSKPTASTASTASTVTPVSNVTHPSPRPATISPSEKSRRAIASLRFAIDSLSEGTRQRVLFSLIVYNETPKSINDPATITALDKEIQALHLPAYYAKPIHREFGIDLLKDRPIDPSFWSAINVQTPDGQTLTMASILGTAPQKYILDCWSPEGSEIRFSFPESFRGQYSEKEYRVLHIAIGDGSVASLEKWRTDCRRQQAGIPTDQYYLTGLHSSLPKLLHIDAMPRYIGLDNGAGKIEDPNIIVWQLERIPRMHTSVETHK